MREWVIYVLKDPRTGRVRYVGWTTNLKRRVAQHIRMAPTEGTHKGHWIAGLVRAGNVPSPEIVERGVGPSWSEVERQWIAHFRAIGESLTNATDGGEGMLGYRPSPESVAKTRAALLGRRQSPEHVAALAAVRKGRIPVAATIAAARATRGQRQSLEHVAKRMVAHIGRLRPELHRLTTDQVREIRAARGLISQRALAARFNVGPTLIHKVQTRSAYHQVV